MLGAEPLAYLELAAGVSEEAAGIGAGAATHLEDAPRFPVALSDSPVNT